LARAIHDAGPRVSEPFLAVNCGALPHELIESELFGVCKGAFTGATEDKPGIFRAAKKGTVFLDEIAEMPQPAQVKLLRVLQEKEVRPVGGTKSFGIDARIIAATNRPLRLLRGQYLRDDLYYRLATAVVEIPPLRFRPEDIGVLARHFADQCAVRFNREIDFDATFLDELRLHDFPGNVRELQGYIEFWASTCDPGPLVLDVESARRMRQSVARIREYGEYLPGESQRDNSHPPCELYPRWDHHAAQVGEDAIRRALRETGGHRANAARMLGISRDTLWRRMRDLGITAVKS
jgi:transcriptional regulator with PAS, ATPase and Fis domain